MANLKKFIWSGTYPGLKVGIYALGSKIGSGKWLKVKELNIAFEGKTKEGKPIGPLEIIMPDLNPTGKCTLIVAGKEFNDCPYKENGKRLEIKASGGGKSFQIWLQDQDGVKTWLWYSEIKPWIELYPVKNLFDLDDVPDREELYLGEAAFTPPD